MSSVTKKVTGTVKKPLQSKVVKQPTSTRKRSKSYDDLICWKESPKIFVDPRCDCVVSLDDGVSPCPHFPPHIHGETKLVDMNTTNLKSLFPNMDDDELEKCELRLKYTKDCFATHAGHCRLMNEHTKHPNYILCRSIGTLKHVCDECFRLQDKYLEHLIPSRHNEIDLVNGLWSLGLQI